MASGDSFLTKPGPTIQMAKKVIKKITKINPIFSTTGGTSDARFIKKIAPCLEFGLVNKTMHRVDECVSLKDLKNLKKIYYQVLCCISREIYTLPVYKLLPKQKMFAQEQSLYLFLVLAKGIKTLYFFENNPYIQRPYYNLTVSAKNS